MNCNYYTVVLETVLRMISINKSDLEKRIVVIADMKRLIRDILACVFNKGEYYRSEFTIDKEIIGRLNLMIYVEDIGIEESFIDILKEYIQLLIRPAILLIIKIEIVE